MVAQLLGPGDHHRSGSEELAHVIGMTRPMVNGQRAVDALHCCGTQSRTELRGRIEQKATKETEVVIESSLFPSFASVCSFLLAKSRPDAKRHGQMLRG